MENKKKIFVGTHVLIANGLATAQKEFNTAVEHCCIEDGNPFSSSLTWEETKDYEVCPDCNRPHHKIKGHWCPFANARKEGQPAVSPSDIEAVQLALQGFCEDCLGSDKEAIRKLEKAWEKILTKVQSV